MRISMYCGDDREDISLSVTVDVATKEAFLDLARRAWRDMIANPPEVARDVLAELHFYEEHIQDQIRRGSTNPRRIDGRIVNEMTGAIGVYQRVRSFQ